MSEEEIKFKLQNGLVAILHPIKSSTVDRLLKTRIRRICSKLQVSSVEFRPSLFAVEVKIESESIYLFYWQAVTAPKHAILRLKHELDAANLRWFTLAFMIYNNAVYYPDDAASGTLADAIIQKVKPCVATLIS